MRSAEKRKNALCSAFLGGVQEGALQVVSPPAVHAIFVPVVLLLIGFGMHVNVDIASSEVGYL